MKVAIIHDLVEEYSGATAVLLDLLDMFPNADLYTLFIDRKEAKNKEIFKKAGRVFCSFLDKIPFFWGMPGSFSAAIFYAPIYWESLNLYDYDLVISSTVGYGSQGVITNEKTLHACYVHTPAKRLYADKDCMEQVNSHFKGKVVSRFLSRRRIWDFVAGQRPDIYLTNSEFTKKRIKKFFRREAEVVYPGVDSIETTNEKKEYYLYFGRVSKLKGVELIINAFNQNGKELMVVGEGKELNYFQKIAKKNIKFTGFVENEDLPKIFQHAKACVFATRTEDFGMVIPEAMSAGVPVIAYNGGGVPEIISNKSVGLLFNDYSVESLNEAIDEFEKNKSIGREECIKRAKSFSKIIFREKILKIINQK